MAIIKGQSYKWSAQSFPNTFCLDLGDPIMVCKDNEEAKLIADGVNQGKVLILDMYRKDIDG